MNAKDAKAKLALMVKAHQKTVNDSEAELVAFALEHNLELYLGEYGRDGRSLVLEDPTDDESDYGQSRGEWLYSSETC